MIDGRVVFDRSNSPAILTGTRGTECERARELVDFMLGLEFQEDIPLNMFVFPANENAALPSRVRRNTRIVPSRSGNNFPPAEIDANRSRWIEEWVEVVTQ